MHHTTNCNTTQWSHARTVKMSKDLNSRRKCPTFLSLNDKLGDIIKISFTSTIKCLTTEQTHHEITVRVRTLLKLGLYLLVTTSPGKWGDRITGQCTIGCGRGISGGILTPHNTLSNASLKVKTRSWRNPSGGKQNSGTPHKHGTAPQEKNTATFISASSQMSGLNNLQNSHFSSSHRRTNSYITAVYCRRNGKYGVDTKQMRGYVTRGRTCWIAFALWSFFPWEFSAISLSAQPEKRKPDLGTYHCSRRAISHCFFSFCQNAKLWKGAGRDSPRVSDS